MTRASPATLTVTASLSAMSACAVPWPDTMDTWEAGSPDRAPSDTENLSVGSGTRSLVTGMAMVCVVLSGDPAGKVTVPPGATKSLAVAVPGDALQVTVRGLAIPRLSVTVNTAFSPSSTSPGGPLMATTARSLSFNVKYTGSTHSVGAVFARLMTHVG